MGKGKFVEVGKLLEDSCRSKYVKIWSSRSKFVWASGNFVFF